MRDDEWYWRRGEETFGPVTRQELRRLWRRHRITHDDEIRAGTGVWESAATIPQTISAEGRSANASEAAGRALAARHRMLFSGADDTGTTGPSFLTRLGRGLSTAGDRLSSVAAVLSGCAALPGRVIGRKTTLGVLGVVLAIVLLKSDLHIEPPYEDVYQRYALILSEAKGLAAREASDAEWTAFEQNVRQELAPVVEELRMLSEGRPLVTRTLLGGSDNDLTAQLLLRPLLQIGQYGLPRLIQNGRAREPLGDAEIAKELEFVRSALEGNVTAPDADRRAIAANKASQRGPDRAVLGIVALDTVLLAGGIAVWLRRRRAG